MDVNYRTALPADAAACVDLRGKTRENAVSAARLAEIGITAESWGQDIRDGTLPGFVGLAGDQMIGYCFGDKNTGEIVVLALLPEFENLGIGKRLFSLAVEHLVSLGHRRLFLGCSSNPQHRSHGFYRHLGWRSTGHLDAHRDEILEYFPLGSAR